MTFRPHTLTLFILLSLPARATDYQVEYGAGPPPMPISGQLNGDMFLGDVDPTYHRPNNFCSAPPRVGNYRYDTIAVTNIGTEEVEIDLEIDTGFCDGKVQRPCVQEFL